MIAIDNILVSDEIVKEQFVCDLTKCKGACCVDGDAGAPLSKDELDKLKDNKSEIAWGNQIRSYVLHPYKMIKDLRTRLETGDVDRILDGDLDDFIKASLTLRKKEKLAEALTDNNKQAD